MELDRLGINLIGEVKMRLVLTVEAQNCTENGLSKILKETIDKLSFLTDKSIDLESKNNYGTEFRQITIIPSCVDDRFWNALGWKERKQIWRKRGEAEIRLRMNYERFIKETLENRYLLFYDVIIKSIQVVQEHSKGDFSGNELIRDILLALNVSEEELTQFNN